MTVPTFQVAEQTVSVDVAGAYSGLYFLRQPVSSGALYVQRTVAASPDPPMTVNLAGPTSGSAIVVDAQGGFTAAWHFGGDVWVRFLDALGTPTGTPLRRSNDDAFQNGTPSTTMPEISTSCTSCTATRRR